MKNPYLPPKTINGGGKFEEFVIGRTSRKRSPIKEVEFDEAVRLVLRRWDNKTIHPDTIVSEVLYHHVLRSLRSFGIQIQSLLLLHASGTLADALFQSDVIFFAKTGDGRDLVATIDVAFFGRFFEKSNISLADSDYLLVQNELYLEKRQTKEKNNSKGLSNWPFGRPKNHFILSLNDLQRRGLKRLGRLIANSLAEEYFKPK